MNDFDQTLAKRDAIKRCGTATTWPTPPPTYLIPKREPVNFELVRYLWPELETTK